MIANRFNHICYLHSYYSVEIESCEIADVLSEAKKWVDALSLKLKEFQLDQSGEDFIIYSSNKESKRKTNNKKMDIDEEVEAKPTEIQPVSYEKSKEVKSIKKLNILKVDK